MKNRNDLYASEFKTRFWANAAASLPPRYAPDLKRAESWELRIDRAVEILSTIKAAFTKTFHTPRGAH